MRPQDWWGLICEGEALDLRYLVRLYHYSRSSLEARMVEGFWTVVGESWMLPVGSRHPRSSCPGPTWRLKLRICGVDRAADSADGWCWDQKGVAVNYLILESSDCFEEILALPSGCDPESRLELCLIVKRMTSWEATVIGGDATSMLGRVDLRLLRSSSIFWVIWRRSSLGYFGAEGEWR